MRNLLLILLFAIIFPNTYGQDAPVKGSYYDLKGERHKGLIGRNKKTPALILFVNESGNELSKLSPADMKSFVAGKDSFVISHASYLKQYPFLRVVINGKLKMYVSTQIVASVPPQPGTQYNTDLYYYGNDPDNLTEIKSANFLDAMDKILVTRPVLLKKIKLKQYTFNDMEEIVTEYNGTKPGEPKEKPKAN